MQRGTILGPYRVESRLGSGAMGDVYAAVALEGARAVAPGTLVALKVVRGHLLKHPGFFKRFLREAEIGQAVRHPNVVRTLECDSVVLGRRRLDFLAMEHVDGRTLRTLLEQAGKVPEPLCRHLGHEIALGLAAIHEVGVVHRDLKPENVVVTADNAVKVMDLGVARVVDEAVRLSSTGSFVGCLHYAAPEQLDRTSDRLDGRADLHALGIVLYELVTGSHPFPGGAVPEILQHVIKTVPRPLREVEASVSPFLEAVVGRLLEKDPHKRFATAVELASVLERGEEHPWWRARTPSGGQVAESPQALPVEALRRALGRLPQTATPVTDPGATAASITSVAEVVLNIAPGERLGDLVVEGELGRGGYGAVFLAHDAVIGRPVALKVLLPRGAQVTDNEREAFLAEARVVAGIPNPHIVTLYSVHPSEDGGWRIEMEYLDAGSLRDAIEASGRLPAGRATAIARGMLDGLRAAHERGVLHRDVKPANVLLGRDGQVKLTDFGLAKMIADRPALGEDGTAVVGTPWYMAPELFVGAEASVQSDLWAAGAVIHEMLTGSPPFASGSMLELIRRVRLEPPPDLGQDAAPALARVVQRCLAKRPEDRPRSALELIADLDRFGSGSRIPARAADGSGHLFGRADEIRAVTDVLRTVATGRAALLTVHGEAGIGKSALVQEAGLGSGPLGFRWLGVHASPSGLMRPLLSAAYEQLRGADHGRSLEEALDAGDFGAARPVLGKLLAPAADLAVQSRDQVVWALEHLLRGLGGGEPLCLAVEDVHLVTEDAFWVLRELAQRLSTTRFLLLVTRRPPGQGAARIGHPEGISIIEHLELGGLDAESIYRVLEDCAEGLGVEPAVADRIARRSGGNPLIAVELFRHLRQTGSLREVDQVWTATDEWDEAALPMGLRDVFARRLGELDADDRELLETAAVDGTRFEGAALAAVLGQPKLDLLRRLQRLSRRGGVLRVDGEGFAFEHPVLREILYDETAPALRVVLHETFARHLEEDGGALDAERIGDHWDRAGKAERARPYLFAVASAAARRQELRRALAIFARSGALDGEPDLDLFARHGKDLLRLAIAHRDAGRHEDALRLLAALADAGERAGDEGLLVRANVQQVLTRQRQGKIDEGDRDVLLSAALRLAADDTLGQTHIALGLMARRAGDLDEAEREFRKADGIFRELGHERLHAMSLSLLAGVQDLRGATAQAIELWEQAASISERIGRHENAAVDRVNVVHARMALGRLDGNRESLESAVRTFELLGLRVQVAKCRAFLAELCYALGDVPAAVRAADRSVRGARDAGSDQTLAHCLLVAGRLDVAVGALVRASSRFDEAGALVENLGHAELAQHVCARKALLAACVGDVARAEDQATRALELNAELDDTPESLLAELYVLAAFGAGAAVWTLAERVVEESAGHDGEAPSPTLALVRGARSAVTADGPVEALADAAAELRSDHVGEMRSELRIVGEWFEALALRRQEDPRAVSIGERAASSAALLGHVFLEAALLRSLDAWSPDDARRERRHQLLRRVGSALPDAELERRIWDVWTA